MTVDYAQALGFENVASFKTKNTALRKALDWARLNHLDGVEPEEIEVAKPFPALVWQGQGNVRLWLLYDVLQHADGWSVYVFRFTSNPTTQEN